MEKLGGGNIEFICLSCGLQGLCSVTCPGSVESLGEMLCPKCGSYIITTLPFKEKASLALTV